jgi:hypothetical protein
MFREELLLADGSKSVNKYSSAIGQNLDVVQALHLMHGYRANIDSQGLVVFGRGSKHGVPHRNVLSTFGAEGHKQVPVSCVTTELGTIVIRQRGKVGIVGNCPDLPPNHVRSRQRPAIIALAKEIRAGTPAPATPPGQWLNAEDWTWKTVTISGTGLDGHTYAFPLDTSLNKFPESNSATPPGQWLSSSAWTWASVSIAGEGLNGKTYKFTYDKAANTWVAS